MAKKVIASEIIIDDDEELTAVFLRYDGGYFSISKIADEGEIYIEKDDQSFGTYASKTSVKYEIKNNGVAFLFDSALVNFTNEEYLLNDNNRPIEIEKALRVIFESQIC